MHASWLIKLYVLVLSVLSSIAVASSLAATQLYDAREAAPEHPYWAFRRALQHARLHRRDTLQNSTRFARSWDGTVLLKLDSSAKISQDNIEIDSSDTVEIVCTKCYVQGLAKVELQIPDNFNASGALLQTLDAIETTVKNITDTVETDVYSYYETELKNMTLSQMFTDGEDLVEGLPVPLPQLNISLNIDPPPVPEVILSFELDDLEVYLALDVTFDSKQSYDINLYTSETPLGIHVGGQEIGITFTVDLVMDVDAAADISGGFHLKFEDGVRLEAALFNRTVDKLVHNGAAFEMLPVVLESADIFFGATLRLGLHAGLDIISDDFPLPRSLTSIGAGVEASIYADIVSLSTNFTYAHDDKDCEVGVVNEYQFGLLAAAGATVEVGHHTWKPQASWHRAIYTTTIDKLCGQLSSSTGTLITSTPVATQAHLSTTTTETTMTYTGVSCQSSVVGNCPASLQITARATDIMTLTTVVSSGAEVTWPSIPGVTNAVISTVPFANGAVSISPTSGVPVAYTAPITAVENAMDSVAASVNMKLILGLAIGLGLGAVIAGITAAVCICKRRKRKLAYAAVVQHGGSTLGGVVMPVNEKLDKTQTPVVEIREL